MATNKGADAPTTEAPAKAAKAPHNCACLTGTGQTCPSMTLKAFAQGHDARMSSRVAQLIADGKLTEAAGLKLVADAGGSDLLVGKTKRSAALRQERKTKPAGEKPAPAKDKAAKDTAKASEPTQPKAPSLVGTKVKARHNGKEVEAVVVRNASNDLVARHRVNGQNVDHPVTVVDGKITKVG